MRSHSSFDHLRTKLQSFTMTSEPEIRILLAHNVPRFIEHIKNRGGVTNEEFSWLTCDEDCPDYPEAVLMRADEYLLYPSNTTKFKKGMFVLTLTLAIMSFFPGGVKVFGLHFCSELENFVSDETSA